MINNSAIKLNNISKVFPNGIIANKNINLELKYGEIHALLGENGAGKSTLVKIIFGEKKQTKGTIEINGKLISFYNSEIANSYKIGVVHQHFSLIDEFTIYENVILGSEMKSKKNQLIIKKKFENKLKNLEKWFKLKGYDKNNPKDYKIFQNKLFDLTIKKDKKIISFFSKTKERFNDLKKIIKKYSLNLKLNDYIKNISISQQQKSEILKLLSKKSKIIIFDEPTSVLTLKEIDQFLNSLIKYKDSGKAILFITHKIDEIKKVADKVSIIRNGIILGTYDVSKISKQEMIEKMVEGEKIFDINKFKRNKISTENCLVVKNLNFFSFNKKERLHNINLTVKKGEIVGIAGIENNGQKNLLESIMGIEKNINGEIKLDGSFNFISHNFSNKKKLSENYDVQTLKKNGVSYIPRDRLNEALLKEESIYTNICFNSFKNKNFFSGFFKKIQKEKIKKITIDMIKKYSVKGFVDIEDSIDSLSGGNQQKFIIGRELLNKPILLLIDQPTWGIDKLSIGFIYEQFMNLRNRGKSILFTSTDLNEILTLSDRILVMSRGRIVGEVKPTLKNAANKISALMTKTIK